MKTQNLNILTLGFLSLMAFSNCSGSSSASSSTNNLKESEMTTNSVSASLPPVPLPIDTTKIIGAQIIFGTGYDNKDHDSEIEIFIKDNVGKDISYKKYSEDIEFKDRSESGPIILPINFKSLKSDLLNGSITIKLKAKGDDNWNYHPKIKLIWSDKSSSQSDWLGKARDLKSTKSHWTGDDNWSITMPKE